MSEDYQVDHSALGSSDWDAVVIGAGPAGSIAALALARSGRKVLLLERHWFPRDKVCGDALITDSLNALKRAGLYDQVKSRSFESRRVVVYSPSRIEIAIPAESLVIKREVFDALLARAAAEAGATVARGEVVEVSQSDQVARISVAGSARSITAKVVVLATGARGVLLRRLDMLQRTAPMAIASRCYVRSPVRVDDLILSLDRSVIPGYAWIFPLPQGEYNVGCGIFDRGGKGDHVNLRRIFGEFLQQFPTARRIVERATHISPLQGAMLRCGLHGSRSFQPPRVIAIGESAATTFPFTGEGIGKAMESGELAARVVSQALEANDLGQLRDFPNALQQLEPKYLGYRIAEDWLSKRWISDLVARRARNSRFMMEALEGILTEMVDPRVIFSLRGLWKSLWV